MRSSETRALNVLADGGRRGSKALKLRISKPPLPPSVDQTPAHASLLYSLQLWQASGQLQQRLSCERGLYFPELSVSAPVEKQLIDDSTVDVQQGKRVKLTGGQQRRASFRDASASDSTPPGTPHGRNRTAGEERLGNPFTSSSSSRDVNQSQQRRELLVSTLESDIVWPLVVPSKRRRGSRSRRIDWSRWQMVLHGVDSVDVAVLYPVDRSSNQGSGENVDTTSQLFPQQQQQQQQLLAHNGQQLQQLLCDKQQHAAAADQRTGGQQQQAQQQQGEAIQQEGCERVKLRMHPPADKVASTDASVPLKATAGKIAMGDASPGHETSQSSEMTCMQESPSAAAAPLSSWPSTSTDSDCQGQPPVIDAVQKPGTLTVDTTGASGSLAASTGVPGQSESPGSPSSPFTGVVM